MGQYTDRAVQLRPIIIEAAQSLDDQMALSAIELYDKFEDLVGSEVLEGRKMVYDGQLWKVRQKHVVMAEYPPSINTASLYARIEEDHTGASDDPIPYDMTMAVTGGLYYEEDGVVYRCLRDSGVPLYARCDALIGNYFERA